MDAPEESIRAGDPWKPARFAGASFFTRVPTISSSSSYFPAKVVRGGHALVDSAPRHEFVAEGISSFWVPVIYAAFWETRELPEVGTK